MSSQYQPSWSPSPLANPVPVAGIASPERKKRNFLALALGLLSTVLTISGLFLPYFTSGSRQLTWANAPEFDGSRAPFFLALTAVLLALIALILAFFLVRSSIASALYIAAGLTIASNVIRNFSPSSFDSHASRGIAFWLLSIGAFLLLLTGIVLLVGAIRRQQQSQVFSPQSYPGQYFGHEAPIPQQFTQFPQAGLAAQSPSYQQSIPSQQAVPPSHPGMAPQHEYPSFPQGGFQQPGQHPGPMQGYPQQGQNYGSAPHLGSQPAYTQQGFYPQPVSPQQAGQNFAIPTQNFTQAPQDNSHQRQPLDQATHALDSQTTHVSNAQSNQQEKSDLTDSATAAQDQVEIHKGTQETPLFSQANISETSSAQKENTPGLNEHESQDSDQNPNEHN